MNNDKVQGKFEQVAGKIKQSTGEIIGNDKLANSGVADQIKGAARETWGNVKDAAGAMHDDAKAKARVENDHLSNRSENTAHNIRENIVASARNVRDSVNEKLDKVQHEHNR